MNTPKANPPRTPRPSDKPYARWLHQLRNELNTVSMACAAADALLAGGAVELAADNMQRATKACARSAALLDEAPDIS